MGHTVKVVMMLRSQCMHSDPSSEHTTLMAVVNFYFLARCRKQGRCLLAQLGEAVEKVQVHRDGTAHTLQISSSTILAKPKQTQGRSACVRARESNQILRGSWLSRMAKFGASLSCLCMHSIHFTVQPTIELTTRTRMDTIVS